MDLLSYLNSDPTWQNALNTASNAQNTAPGLVAEQMRIQAVQQADQAERARRAQVGKAISSGKLTDDALAEIAAYDPDLYIDLLDQQRKQRMQNQKTQLFEQIFGGSAAGGDLQGDPAAVVAAGMASGDPQLMQLGTFLQSQQNRKEDKENERAKEERALQEKMDAEKRKADQKKIEERRKLSIPGYDLSDDANPTAANVTDAQALGASVKSYEEVIDRIDKQIGKYGSEVLPTNAQDEIASSFQDLLNLERVLANTGVLNKGEVPFLEQTYAAFDPRNPKNLLRKNTEMQEKAREFLKIRKAKISETLKGYGYSKKPSIEGARRAKDGKLYIKQANGKYAEVIED